MPLAVRHNTAAQRFELDTDDGRLAVADYRLRRDGVVTFTHTGVPFEQRGRGIAAALIEAALDWARQQKLQVVPACSYVARYMERHPETEDLLLALRDRPVAEVASASDVLGFWFDGECERDEWFTKDAAFDASIRERFGATIDAALAGELDGWNATPEGALARIVVLDQFTRNVFRDSPRAYAGDAQALTAARALVAGGDQLRLAPVQRQFVYLPLEHSENMADQREAVRLFEQLGRDAPALAGLTEWAVKHLVIVERFGRFPHRNACFGRASTAEEIEFLKQPGSGF